MPTYRFIVPVECDDEAGAHTVMCERLDFDEQYDHPETGEPFGYQFGDVVLIGRSPHQDLLNEYDRLATEQAAALSADPEDASPYEMMRIDERVADFNELFTDLCGRLVDSIRAHEPLPDYSTPKEG